MAKKDTKQKPVAKQQPPMIIPDTILTIALKWKEIEPAYEKVIQKLAKRLNLPGFRKGMVPIHIAEQQLKPEAIIEPVLQQLLPDRYRKLIESEQKKPISDPEFVPKTTTKGSDWEIEVHLAERPKVDVAAYKKIIAKAKKEALAHIKEEEQKSKKPTDDHHRDDHILQHMYQDLVQEFKPQMPELLVKQQTRRELERLVKELESMKLTLDDFLQRNQQTFEQLSSSIAARALGQLQLEFILQAIVEKAEIAVTDQEIEAEIASMKDQKLTAEQKKDPYLLNLVREHLSRKKLFTHLLESA